MIFSRIAAGVDHIDTSDFYGPHITNQLIREALHPYRDDLVIVTKVGAKRGSDASWNPAFTPAELESAVHDNLRATICALPTQADWLRRDLRATVGDEGQRARVSVVEQSIFEPSPAADAVLISNALKALPDADATHALHRAAENLLPGGRVLLIEETFDIDDLDEHDGEADLLALTVHGSGLRTPAELDAVIANAGLVRTETHTVGWGTTVHDLAPANPH